MWLKQDVLHSQALRAAARTPCVRCGAADKGAVLAHYSSFRSHSYGKGMSKKGDDLIGAHLCSECHDHFDRHQCKDDIVESEDFLHCVMLTILRLRRDGLIKVTHG